MPHRSTSSRSTASSRSRRASSSWLLPTTSTPSPIVRNLLFLTLLLTTLSHAFVTSNRFLEHAGVRGRVGWLTQSSSSFGGALRGGAADSGSSRLNVMQVPPAIAVTGLSSDGEDERRPRAASSAEGDAETKPPRRRVARVSSSSLPPPPPPPQQQPPKKKNGQRQEPIDIAEYVAETKLPTDIGQFQLRAYRVAGAPPNRAEPCVIYARDKPPMGSAAGGGANHVPVRIHDQCLTSEVFRSQRCDCKEQLHMALAYIQKHGGCIIYLQQEGRGIGLANKIAAYALQDIGLDTVEANLHLGFAEDEREYGVVKSILDDLRIDGIQLMTNNPRKVERLERLGINVERTLPMVVATTNPYNRKYLETKEKRMRHSNLAELLARKQLGGNTLVDSEKEQQPDKLLWADDDDKDVLMAARKNHIAEQYINNGTEMTANAVQVSLMVEEDVDDDDDSSKSDDEKLGVLAEEDGYCFGRQSVVDAIDAVARGEMVVVVDDMDRENEGDFIMAADQCTDLDMARIVRYSSGVVCIAMEDERLKELKLPPMVTNNEDPKETAFTVSVDASKAHGITTGISASDRATTARLLADPSTAAADFSRPGHMFPLRARPGGVLTRDGHTEASIDLARLAGRQPCGVLCEIVSEENPTEMMRLPEIKRFCKRHGLVLTSIVDLAQYRREEEGQE